MEMRIFFSFAQKSYRRPVNIINKATGVLRYTEHNNYYVKHFSEYLSNTSCSYNPIDCRWIKRLCVKIIKTDMIMR